MNYAIKILKDKLENTKMELWWAEEHDKEQFWMDKIENLKEDIDDLETAIHNLEMLEPKTERFEKVGMIPDEGVDQLNDLFKYFGDTFNPQTK